MNNKGITAKKSENFSEWYTQIIQKCELADLRYNVKGFLVFQPWSVLSMEKIYDFMESTLQRKNHKPYWFPTLIPESNLKKESSHIKGFTPEVFWVNEAGNNKLDERLALRPTSETAFYQMFSLWIRSYKDLPFKTYQRANVFRYETKATRPLIRTREIFWIEAHDAFATKKEAEEQVQEDIEMTDSVMHQIFGVPFIPMKRPTWDKFPGAEYTIGSDSILPDGKVIQQPSTHLLGQNFSKSFDVKFTDEKEKENYVWQTCYGPAISRILASVISIHGDDFGLVLPFTISPIQVVIVPIIKSNSPNKIDERIEDIRFKLFSENIEVEVDYSEKRPGEKFFFWEMKGVPFRIEIGEEEIKSGKAIVFIRDTKEKIKVDLKNLSEDLKNFGVEYDVRLRQRADEFFSKSIVNCKDKDSIKKSLDFGHIARFDFCSVEKDGEKCAEYIEKELQARVMGIRVDKKEKASGKCSFCNKKANEVVYAGKSY